jgi:hypothetical protein
VFIFGRGFRKRTDQTEPKTRCRRNISSLGVGSLVGYVPSLLADSLDFGAGSQVIQEASLLINFPGGKGNGHSLAGFAIRRSTDG